MVREKKQLKAEQKDRHRKSEREYTERLLGPTMCVRPAPGGKEFHLHVLQLQKKSDYFQSLQSSGLREARDQEVDFNFTPGACEAFEAVAQYMYDDKYEPKGSSEARRCIEAAYVFVLADRLLMPELKSLALAGLYNIFDSDANGVKFWHGILSRGCHQCPCDQCGQWRRQQQQVSYECPQCSCSQCMAWCRHPQQEEFDKPATLKVTSESTIFNSEHIEEMKAVLYDGYIDMDDEPELRTASQIIIPEPRVEPVASTLARLGSESPVPKDADEASEAAVSVAGTDSTDSDIYASPFRDAQLQFSKHLSQHLPALQANTDFKRLLASGSLDGPFMVDLLCTHHEEKAESQ